MLHFDFEDICLITFKCVDVTKFIKVKQEYALNVR